MNCNALWALMNMEVGKGYWREAVGHSANLHGHCYAPVTHRQLAPRLCVPGTLRRQAPSLSNTSSLLNPSNLCSAWHMVVDE